MAYCHCVRFYLLYTVAMFSAVPVLMASSTDESKKAYAKEIIAISGNGSAATASGTDYENWVLNAPLPLESSKIQKQLRLRRRSLYKEKVPKYLVASTSPYSSLVYVSIGCIGTFISPVHVLTAAHCVHDGVRIRQGPMMNRLKIGRCFHPPYYNSFSVSLQLFSISIKFCIPRIISVHYKYHKSAALDPFPGVRIVA